MKTTAALFYIERPGNEEAGPYDVVQMAGLLRRKIINGQTQSRREGEDAWMPLSWQPQFTVIREMPPDAVSNRIAALDEEAMSKASGPLPMPSRETVMKLAGLFCSALLAGLVAFVLAWLDQTTGYYLMWGGIAAVAVAQCLTIVRLFDEDYLTLILVFFVPLGDIFYFISNIWQYFNLFCVKYVGAAVILGAAAGLAMHHGH